MKNKKKFNSIIIINIIIVLFTIIDVLGLFSLYHQYTKIVNNNIQAVQNVKDINFYLRSIDNNILYSINKITNNPTSNVKEYTDKVNTYIGKCNKTMESYSSIQLTSIENKRFELFKVYYQSYEKKINSLLSVIEAKNSQSAQDIYSQELLPVRNCITELLDALNYLSTTSSEIRMANAKKGGQMICFSIIVIAIVLIITVDILYKNQKRTHEQLENSNKTIIQQKNTIQNAIFKDVITDAYNRMSFLEDFSDEKKKLNENESGYFIMFNIDGFHRINFNYGNNVGDMILSEVVKRLHTVFNNNRIYRTGSDEFVVLIKMPSTSESYNKVTELINNAKLTISKPYQLNPGIVNISCSISCVYTNGACTLSSDLLETSSEAIKQGRMSGYGNTTFINTENNQSYLLSN
ncbi:MAG: diguanylate cyclase domain-containing protein [Oscillospiraceae bacterium]